MIIFSLLGSKMFVLFYLSFKVFLVIFIFVFILKVFGILA